jgi:glycosyltransferase involved in cell wall biosynthesis
LASLAFGGLATTSDGAEADGVGSSYTRAVRVALVHDWLTGMRGGERVLHQIAQIFPDADLYTLLHVPGSTSQIIESRSIFSSPLSRLPGAERHYRKLLPLFPWAIRRFRIENVDLVLSTHHAVAKSVPLAPGIPHLSYCFTPMRYIWDQADAYLGRGLSRALTAPLVAALRRFDLRTSGPDQVTRFVASSNAVAHRIALHYRREAEVVFPPVEVERFRPEPSSSEDFYLLVGGFVPYKCEGLAIECFRHLGRRLVVAGDGPGRAALAARAPANVEFTGRIPDDQLAELYARCRALIYPQEEDFGIAAVEAQAAGRPVIAYGRGGALDTVVPLRDDEDEAEPTARDATGIHFDQQTPDALAAAVERFEKQEARFDSRRIRSWAERFAPSRFRRELRAQIEQLL